MYAHGASGRKFAGRVLQVVTGSTGIDDFEWGVTLFAVHPDDLKEVVYTMRFDEASALYAEFGPFYTGMVGAARRGARAPSVSTDPRGHAAPPPGVSSGHRGAGPAYPSCSSCSRWSSRRRRAPRRARRRRAREEGSGEREITVQRRSTARAPRTATTTSRSRAPVIVVTDAADEVVDEVETDEEGKATITLPGEGQFTATLDLDSLGDDVGLPARGRRGHRHRPEPRPRAQHHRSATGSGPATTKLDQIPQLLFNGLSFGLIIAICSVGLSLIFGTTGPGELLPRRARHLGRRSSPGGSTSTTACT